MIVSLDVQVFGTRSVGMGLVNRQDSGSGDARSLKVPPVSQPTINLGHFVAQVTGKCSNVP